MDQPPVFWRNYMKEIRFDGRTAIVTGAGAGLGRSHALGLAMRGANVVVNDLGVSTDGSAQSSDAAQAVVHEITDRGGKAIANGANVADFTQVQDMVNSAIQEFGSIDILVNNAGILRDKSFAKMELDNFRLVVDVHLMGSVNCTKAVWNHMVDQGYGRIVMTTSTSGMYGNFGQSNYGAAKAGVFGLMNVLAQEGATKNIRVNTLAPTAATRMTEELLTQDVLELLEPETITPGLLMLVSEDAPTKMVLGAGAGCFTETRIVETAGVSLVGDDLSPEGVAAALEKIRDSNGETTMDNAFSQTRKYARMAAAARGLPLPWNEVE
jgi:NAD(P)-dependent dehydrogenase (short-subunit alcohol dehydrogenase family)